MQDNPKFLWWQTGVIYQVYPRSFKDSNGDGIGDLQGVIQKLDYLSGTLGIDAIWLSPFYPSPMADFGYDISDYTSVDPLFGSLADFDELTTQVHRRGMKIIIDFVPNHTSNQHPWFLESRSSRQSPKRSWYVWADAKSDGALPNNWLSVFGGPAWEWDETTGQFYLHKFLKEQPDLNWRNPEVQEAMFGVVRFWLERGVDGFRIDVAHYIMKDPLFRDNPPNLSAKTSIHKPLGAYDTQLHLYDKGHPDVHALYRRFRKLLDAYSVDQPRMSVGEIHIFDWKEWASYYGEQLDELHMPFNFALLGVKWQASAVRHVVDALESVLLPGAWPNYVMGNHDESRLASRIGLNAARLAAMLLLTLRGTPTLYYGDEIGMTDVPISPDQQQDPWGIRVPGLGRDSCRTPMQWDSSPNAGFSSDETPHLWLPLSKDHQQVNVQRHLEVAGSILNLYIQLLRCRKNSPALKYGSYRPLDARNDDCFVFLREADGFPAVLVLLNFSPQDVSVSFSQLGVGSYLLSTFLDRTGRVDLNNLRIRGNEGLIIELDHGVS
jgi:alpha-glucosidase